ncbi:protein kinase [Aliikangiella marina]|uniref:Protein kinase n=1 Tax=Aliikangiella marina TaxID=1712262 RepID=A0A545T6E5_9GAMM|nr:protein kinase [Aliikangiella marina]TQV72800.1 protein kinase [Aliikangiella marina]
MAKVTPPKITEFNLLPGEVIADKYEIVSFLGGGWEGEVYKIRELVTNIDRTAKLFYPKRNLNNRTITQYAKKLHRLQNCDIIIHYHTTETLIFNGVPITVLISEYVEGELLSDHIKKHRGKKLPTFQAVHLLHALATGISSVHQAGEYHGDLHDNNIIVQRLGLTYQLKLLDLYHHGRTTRENRDNDVCEMIGVFYEALGGQKAYSGHSKVIKNICCGLKRSLINKKFRRAIDLCDHLESLDWSSL